MSETSNYYESFQEFLDGVQYSKHGVKKYEWIFGEGFLSTGGVETTKEIVPKLDLKEGQRVLDIGCGLGGHDFFMAENYGVYIDAVDLSKNMMSVALQHFSKKPHIKDKIKFRICDVTDSFFPDNHYDAIYSRDALLHISDKEKLFTNFFKWLKPGGRIVFSDYCRGEREHNDEFKKYIAQRGYHLYTVLQYEELLKSVGFVKVEAHNQHHKFVESLQRELKKLYDGKDEFLQHFNTEDFDDLEIGWQKKIKRSKDGDQTWALCYGQKPLN